MTQDWTLQQIRNMLFHFDVPKYLIRDSDARYGSTFSDGVNNLEINKDSPDGSPVQIAGKIEKIPTVNGLHHVYFRQAA